MSDEERLQDMLAGAIPPLAAPEDRIGQVAARVRRGRRRSQFGALAAAAAVIITATTTAITLSAPAARYARPTVASPSPAASVAVGDCP
ncbi:MAG TPA: hypothetical protein VH442_07525, partial [Micromonosporaceae bacterium]